MLVQEMKNSHTDIFFMISKSTRILMTNRKCEEVVNNIEHHDIIKSILSRDSLTAQQLQCSLEPLIRVWSSGKSFVNFLPNAKQPQSVEHCRPIFQLANVRPFLDDQMKTKVGMSSLLWQFSTDMYSDAMSFRAFRPGTKHKSEMHAYIALISSCFLYNIYREHRVQYPSSSPVCLDYASESYGQVMDINPADLSKGPEPARRHEDVIDIKLQMSKSKKRKNSH